jgi:hypothetical protein
MAAAKIPKNWFYVSPLLSKSTLKLRDSIDVGPISLQLARLIRAPHTQHHPPTFKRLFL